ncbi:MAG: hypothetical protein ACTSP5_12230 [Candidatus Heimdallarchaeota archaeon]
MAESPVVVDIDHDGKEEIIFGDNVGYVYSLNSSGLVEWSYQYPGEEFISAPAIADLNNDTIYEIVIGGATGDAVYCLNEIGQQNWVRDSISSFYTPVIADVDADGYQEILAFEESNKPLQSQILMETENSKLFSEAMIIISTV